MQEKRRARTRTMLAPASGGFDDPGPAAPETVMVTHGPYAEALPVAEMSVAEIRRRFHDRLDIHPQAAAFVDGVAVDESTTVRAGQLLMFVRRSGEKGVAAWTD